MRPRPPFALSRPPLWSRLAACAVLTGCGVKGPPIAPSRVPVSAQQSEAANAVRRARARPSPSPSPSRSEAASP